MKATVSASRLSAGERQVHRDLETSLAQMDRDTRSLGVEIGHAVRLLGAIDANIINNVPGNGLLEEVAAGHARDADTSARAPAESEVEGGPVDEPAAGEATGAHPPAPARRQRRCDHPVFRQGSRRQMPPATKTLQLFFARS